MNQPANELLAKYKATVAEYLAAGEYLQRLMDEQAALEDVIANRSVPLVSRPPQSDIRKLRGVMGGEPVKLEDESPLNDLRNQHLTGRQTIDVVRRGRAELVRLAPRLQREATRERLKGADVVAALEKIKAAATALVAANAAAAALCNRLGAEGYATSFADEPDLLIFGDWREHVEDLFNQWLERNRSHLE